MSRLVGAIRQAWLIVGVTLVCVAVVEIGLRVLLAAPNDLAERVRTAAAADTYGGAEWAAPLLQEYSESFVTRWQPYVYWRHAPHRGAYVNVSEQGLRRTWNPGPVAGTRPSRIFVFGGSTVWGTGARDDHTIPSELSRRLNGKGHPVQVSNFGQSGYVSSQEVIALYTRLQQGDVPDLVIFYDGINDAFSSFQNRVAGLPQNESRRVSEFNLTRRPSRLLASLARSLLPGFRRLATRLRPAPDRHPLPESVTAPLIRDTLAIYRRNRTLVQRMGAAYGFRVLFYWQPVLYTRTLLSPSERRTLEAEPEDVREFFLATWRKVASNLQSRSLADIFDQAPGSFFIDFAHLGELGDSRVAARIATDVEKLDLGRSR